MREKEEKRPRIAYLCDGRRPCRDHKGCYRNGGTCRHTSKVENAENFTSWSGRTYSENKPDTVAKTSKKALTTVSVSFAAGIMLGRYLTKN